MSLYETDFCLWADEQAALLKVGRFDELDLANLVEEVEDLARRSRQEIRSRLRVLIMHLLKWCYQQDRREGSTWRSTIIEQRREIDDVILDSPSLRSYPETVLDRAYALARKDAQLETELDLQTFPDACPWTIERILDSDFWPET